MGQLELLGVPVEARMAGVQRVDVEHGPARQAARLRSRALWEPSAGETDAINNYGTSLALELLPYWTNGCIGSQEGLYFESSATKDAHFLTVSELADQPSNPVRGLVYGTTGDFQRGIEHAVARRALSDVLDERLQSARRFVAAAPTGAHRARRRPAGPQGLEGLRDPRLELVVGLDTEPVVATMHAGTRTSCLPNSGDLPSGELDTRLTAWECATDRVDGPDAFNRPVVSSGPKSWQHVDLQPRRLTKVTTPGSPPSSLIHANGPSMLAPLGNVPERHITPARVSDVHETVSSISFHVDELGKPVVVRTSFFPNWQAHGADGPYRVAPNLMVVIPRRHDVRLEYGLTSADWLGRIGTLLGVVLLVLMIWRWRTVPPRGPRRRARRESDDDDDDDLDGDGGGGDLDRDGDDDDDEAAATPLVAGGDTDRDGLGPEPVPERPGEITDARAARPSVCGAHVARRHLQGLRHPRRLSRRDRRGSRPPGRQRVRSLHRRRPGARRPRHAAVVGAARRRVHRGRHARRRRRHRPRPGLDRPRATSRRAASTRPARCSPRATTRRSTTASSCAGPARRPSARRPASRQIKATVAAGVRRAGRGRRARSSTVDLLARLRRRTCASFVDVDRCCGRSGSSPTPRTAWAASSCPTVFAACRSSSTVLFGELDGTFPNHPADPIQPENLKDLASAPCSTSAPTSASRSTATPTACSSSTTRASRSRARPRRRSSPQASSTSIPGETVVHNLICSKAVPEVIRENGGMPVRTRVGHSFIKQVMAETGAIFGGEHSAHYYFRDNYRADSGSIAALLVLEQLSRAGRAAVGAAQAVRALRRTRARSTRGSTTPRP